MNQPRRPANLPTLTAAIASLAILVAACGGSTGPLGSVPVGSSSPEPSVAQGSPDLTPAPTADPSGQSSDGPAGSSDPGASATPSGGPLATTLVRTYLWLGGAPGSEGLVAVLRTLPSSKAIATAAVTALLAGPTGAETERSITSAVPVGSQVLGLTIDGGVATINLSSEFASGGDSASVQARLGQVVYTLTQFPTVKSVLFQIEGTTPTSFGGEGVSLDTAVTRADYVSLLPDIWVDRPAFNAAIGNPAHVTGSANVFEATFRISIIDASGKTIADQQVMASCGSGCRGTFDTSIPYVVSKGQYGILRVYNPSAKDGTPESVRDYRVWLTP